MYLNTLNEYLGQGLELGLGLGLGLGLYDSY